MAEIQLPDVEIDDLIKTGERLAAVRLLRQRAGHTLCGEALGTIAHTLELKLVSDAYALSRPLRQQFLIPSEA